MGGCFHGVLQESHAQRSNARQRGDASVTTAYLEITASAVHSQCNPAGFDCHYPTVAIFFFFFICGTWRFVVTSAGSY